MKRLILILSFLLASFAYAEHEHKEQDSDLKKLYLSSYQLQCRMVAPSITQDQILKQHYPNPN